MKRWASFGLIDCDLEGASYTFTNKQSSTPLSRLDRFLFTGDWLEHFDEHREVAKFYFGSDHRVVLLEQIKRLGGPGPFKFELSWLENGEIMDNMRNWWQECEVQG